MNYKHLPWNLWKALKKGGRSGWMANKPILAIEDPFEPGLSASSDAATILGMAASRPDLTFWISTRNPDVALRWMQSVSEPGVVPAQEVCLRVAAAKAPSMPLREPARRMLVGARKPTWPLPNVWMGTQVSTQEEAWKRIPTLLRIPAAGHFLWAEPLDGELNLDPSICDACGPDGREDWVLDGEVPWCVHHEQELSCGHWLNPCASPRRPGIQAVVVGAGERRVWPFHLSWVRDVVRVCRDSAVPCWVTEVGKHPLWDGAGEVPPGHVYATRIAEEHYTLDCLREGGRDPESWPADLRVRQTLLSSGS